VVSIAKAQNKDGVSNAGFVKNVGQLQNTSEGYSDSIQFYGTSGQNAYYWNNRGSLNVCTSAAEGPDNLSVFRFDLNFINHSDSIQLVGGQQTYFLNYFLGQLRETYTDVPVYDGVYCNNLYPGINLYNAIGLETRFLFEIAENVDPTQIRFNIEGALSDTTLVNGGLTCETTLGAWTLDNLDAWQLINDNKNYVPISIVKANGFYNFILQSYDPTLPLFIGLGTNVIPPTSNYQSLNWSTNFQISGVGSNYNTVTDVTLLENDTLLVAGNAQNNLVPITSGLTINNQGSFDAFVIMFKPNRGVAWGSFVGGSGFDHALKVDQDRNGSVYLYGQTYSNNIGAKLCATCNFNLSTVLKGASDNFIVKFNSLGKYGPQALGNWQANTFATLIGGNGDELPGGMAINSLGEVILSGAVTSASSGTFPLVNNGGYFQNILTNNSNHEDGFIMKISGNNLSWSTAFGGYDNVFYGYAYIYEMLGDLAVDRYDNIYATGFTSSPGFFFNSSTYSPYFGYNNTGNIPIVKSSSSSFNALNSGATDALVLKFNSEGSIVWSTCIGGLSTENLGFFNILSTKSLDHISLDLDGNIFIAGNSNSLGSTTTQAGFFPIVSNNNINSINSAANDQYNGTSFICRFNGQNQLNWSTFYPSIGSRITDIAIGNTNKLNIVGTVILNTLPTKQSGISYFRNFHNQSIWDGVFAQFNTRNLTHNFCTYFGSYQIPQTVPIENQIRCITTARTRNSSFNDQIVLGGSISGTHNYPFASRPGTADYFFAYPACSSTSNCFPSQCFVTNFSEICPLCPRSANYTNTNSEIETINYSDGILAINLSNLIKINQVIILNSIGQTLYNSQERKEASTVTYNCNLTAGSYLIQLYDENESLISGKFMVVK
jgi:hypothetical protein